MSGLDARIDHHVQSQLFLHILNDLNHVLVYSQPASYGMLIELFLSSYAQVFSNAID